MNGFAMTVTCTDANDGKRNAIQCAGLGPLTPNTILMGWPWWWSANPKTYVPEFLTVMQQATMRHKAVLLYHNMKDFPLEADGALHARAASSSSPEVVVAAPGVLRGRALQVTPLGAARCPANGWLNARGGLARTRCRGTAGRLVGHVAVCRNPPILNGDTVRKGEGSDLPALAPHTRPRGAPLAKSAHCCRGVALHDEPAAPRPTRPSGPANREDERAGFLLIDVRMPRARLRRVSTPHGHTPIRRVYTGRESCAKIPRGRPGAEGSLRRAHGSTGARAFLAQNAVRY